MHPSGLLGFGLKSIQRRISRRVAPATHQPGSASPGCVGVPALHILRLLCASAAHPAPPRQLGCEAAVLAALPA